MNNHVTLTVSVPREDREALHRYCSRTGIKQTVLLRRLLRLALDGRIPSLGPEVDEIETLAGETPPVGIGHGAESGLVLVTDL